MWSVTHFILGNLLPLLGCIPRDKNELWRHHLGCFREKVKLGKSLLSSSVIHLFYMASHKHPERNASTSVVHPPPLPLPPHQDDLMDLSRGEGVVHIQCVLNSKSTAMWRTSHLFLFGSAQVSAPASTSLDFATIASLCFRRWERI